MTVEENPKPPTDLSAESSAWWTSVIETYELAPHHVLLLTQAARALDRAEAARKALKKNGSIYVDKHGVRRPAPEVLIERNAAVLFSRLVRELRLDNVEDGDTDRIPRNSLNWKRRNEEWRKNKS
jgi:hypothetical protein